MQHRRSRFSHKQSFILGTEVPECACFTTSGVIFNWRNNKRLVVSPPLEITAIIQPPPHQMKQISILILQYNYACRVIVMTEYPFLCFTKSGCPPGDIFISAWLLIRLRGSLRAATSNKCSLGCTRWAHARVVCGSAQPSTKGDLIWQWVFWSGLFCFFCEVWTINIITESNTTAFVRVTILKSTQECLQSFIGPFERLWKKPLIGEIAVYPEMFYECLAGPFVRFGNSFRQTSTVKLNNI